MQFQSVSERGIELRGGRVHEGFGGSESTLPFFYLSYKMQDEVPPVTVLAISAVMAVLVVTATPLKLNPFLTSLQMSQYHTCPRFAQIWCPSLQVLVAQSSATRGCVVRHKLEVCPHPKTIPPTSPSTEG